MGFTFSIPIGFTLGRAYGEQLASAHTHGKAEGKRVVAVKGSEPLDAGRVRKLMMEELKATGGAVKTICWYFPGNLWILWSLTINH